MVTLEGHSFYQQVNPMFATWNDHFWHNKRPAEGTSTDVGQAVKACFDFITSKTPAGFKPLLIAHNGGTVDFKWLALACHWYAVTPPDNLHVLDSLPEARRHFKKGCGIKELHGRLGLPFPGQHHNALDDATALRNIWQHSKCPDHLQCFATFENIAEPLCLFESLVAKHKPKTPRFSTLHIPSSIPQEFPREVSMDCEEDEYYRPPVLKCKECQDNPEFSGYADLRLHLSDHHEGRLVRCPVAECPFEVSDDRGYRTHMFQTHAGILESHSFDTPDDAFAFVYARESPMRQRLLTFVNENASPQKTLQDCREKV